MELKKDKNLLIVLLVLTMGIGLVNVFLIPPFMNPDEIQHFVFSATHAYGEEKLRKLDGEVLELLKEHKWFHFIGVGPGWENTKQLKDIYFINYFSREKDSVSKSYFHFVYGKLLKISGIGEPLKAFYFLRLVSFFIYMGILLFSFYFYRRYFPDVWFYLTAGQLLVVQLGAILNAVNYDVMLTLLGVLFFAVSYRFMDGGGRRDLVFLVLLAAMASLIKTGGILFFLYFFILLVFKYKPGVAALKRLVPAVFVFIIIFSWFNYWFPERFFTLYTAIFSRLHTLGDVVFNGESTAGGLGFFNSILDSFYFHTGWMAFKVHGAWYVVLKIFLLAAVIGVVLGVVSKKLNIPAVERKWAFYALVVIGLQLAAIRIYYGSGLMAQGRYLYPLLIPVMVLIYTGLKRLETCFNFQRPYLLTAYLFFQAVFFIFAFIRIVSAFYLELPSPHPGL